MKKFLRFLLLLALMVPIGAKVHAQCNGSMCSVTIQLYDDYGDGWVDYNSAPFYVQVWQDTIMRGQATLTNGENGSVAIAVCSDDSVRFVFSGSDYYEESSFTILNGDGTTILLNADCSNYSTGQTITTAEVVCPSCIAPMNLVVDDSDSTEVVVNWTGDASAYELVLVRSGATFDSTLAISVNDTTYSFDTLVSGVFYDVYVRTDCGGEYSTWAGPVSFAIGIHVMTANSTDTLRTCSSLIVDDGGALGDYSHSQNTTLFLYPTDSTRMLVIEGTSQTEGSWDYLQIYRGLGTSGELLFTDNTSGDNSTHTFGPFSNSGPMTIYFHSDGSSAYAGFQISVSCVEAPTCDDINGIAIRNLTSDSAELFINDANMTASGYMVTVYSDNVALDSVVITDTVYQLSDLIQFVGGTTYTVTVAALCSDGKAYTTRSANFTPGMYVMAANSNDTLYSCGLLITDDGGIEGSYSNNQNTTLVLYPSVAGQMLVIEGSSQTEGSWDYLQIYRGAGTSGELLFVDNTSGDNSTHTFGPFSNNGPMTIYFHADGSTVYAGFQIRVSCMDAPTCDDIAGIAVRNITSDSAELFINDTSMTASGYFVLLYAGDSIVDSTVITDTVYDLATLATLTPNTEYTVRVSAVCADDTRYAARVATFRTACTPIAHDDLPWSEGFESYTASSYSGSANVFNNPCWVVHDRYGSNYPYVYNSTYVHTGNKALAIYGYSSTRTVMALPGFEDNLSALQLSLWTLSTSTSAYIEVGYMTDANNASTFQSIVECRPTATSVYELFEANFPDSASGRIALRYNGSYNTVYVDDITVIQAPDCRRPEGVRAVVIDSTTVSFVIVDTTGVNNYNIAILSGNDTVVVETVTDTTYTVDTLHPGTHYTIFVKAVCQDGTITNAVSTSFFPPRVLMAAATDLPYTENFDSYGTGSSATIDPCWYKFSMLGSYPYPSSSYAHSGNRSLYFYGSTAQSTYAIMQGIDDLNGLMVTFWAYIASPGSAQLQLGVMTNIADPASFTPIHTTSSSMTASTWVMQEAIIPAGTVGNYLAFRIQGSSTYSSYVDDVTIMAAPTCSHPTMLAVIPSDTSIAEASFTWVGDATGYNVVLQRASVPFDSTAFVAVSDDSVFVDTLVGGVRYALYVQSNCGNETSEWYGPLYYTPGMYIMAANGSDTLRACNVAIYDDGGDGNYSNNQNTTLYLYPTDSTRMLIISGTSQTEGSWDYLQIYRGLGTSGELLFVDNTSGDYAQHAFGPFYIEGPVTIHFYADGSQNYAGFVINVSCMDVPDCEAPDSLAYTVVDNSSATFSWVGTSDNYEYFLTSGNTTIDSGIIADDSVTVTGLTVGGDYVFTVRGVCSNDTSFAQTISLHWGHCVPNPTSVDNSGITNVTFGDQEQVNNNQRPTTAPYYGNYVNMVGSAAAGDDVEVAITYGTGYTYGTIIWVDWNNNFVFDGNEVVYVGTSASDNPTTLTATFAVPATQDTGMYVMRIAGADSYFDTYVGSIAAAANANPCFSASYSVAHDYMLHITTPPTCLRPDNLVLDTATENSIAVNWTPTGDETQWILTINNGAPVTVTDTFYTFTGLSASTVYTIAVRAYCGGNDTSSAKVGTFRTQCGAVSVPFVEDFESGIDCWTIVNPASSTGIKTSNVYSGNQCFAFWYSTNPPQYLISPEINAMNNELAVSFMYGVNSAYYTESFAFGYSTTNNEVNSFTWHTELTGITNQTYMAYNDTVPAGTKYIAIKYTAYDEYALYIDSLTINFTTVIPTCPAPENLAVTGDYESATATWQGSSASYEVAIVEGAWTAPASGIAVSGNTYTFTGLAHRTSYSIGVRGICADSTISDWVLTTFVTDVLPCYTPTNVAVNNITYTTADLSFSAGLGQNTWVVNFMAPGTSTFDTINDTTMTFTGLVSGTSYQVAVRALCSDEDSPWSDTVSFSTLTCPQVTGVTATDITGTTARISWTSTGAAYYIVDYGIQGTSQGQGTSITVSATTVVLTGLDEETPYDVYVRGVCAEGVMGLWSSVCAFTTTAGGGQEPVYYNITVLANPTNAGTVSGGGSFLENSTISISATANDGWTFTGWQDGNTDNPRTITVTENATYTANFTEGVGIEEVTLSDVSLFPNPATSTVTIRAYGMEQVSIIDLNGRTVMTQRVSDNTTTFDVSTLAKGTYFVRIVGEQATAVRKLIVK